MRLCTMRKKKSQKKNRLSGDIDGVSIKFQRKKQKKVKRFISRNDGDDDGWRIFAPSSPFVVQEDQNPEGTGDANPALAGACRLASYWGRLAQRLLAGLLLHDMF